ncbi:hypothetical protein KCU85_g362, partial [Aureobasidium melanogenum]
MKKVLGIGGDRGRKSILNRCLVEERSLFWCRRRVCCESSYRRWRMTRLFMTSYLTPKNIQLHLESMDLIRLGRDGLATCSQFMSDFVHHGIHIPLFVSQSFYRVIHTSNLVSLVLDLLSLFLEYLAVDMKLGLGSKRESRGPGSIVGGATCLGSLSTWLPACDASGRCSSSMASCGPTSKIVQVMGIDIGTEGKNTYLTRQMRQRWRKEMKIQVDRSFGRYSGSRPGRRQRRALMPRSSVRSQEQELCGSIES